MPGSQHYACGTCKSRFSVMRARDRHCAAYGRPGANARVLRLLSPALARSRPGRTAQDTSSSASGVLLTSRLAPYSSGTNSQPKARSTANYDRNCAARPEIHGSRHLALTGTDVADATTEGERAVRPRPRARRPLRLSDCCLVFLGTRWSGISAPRRSG